MKVRLAIFAIALAFSGAAFAGKNDAAVTVVNRSMWEIHQMFLSSSSTDEWGPDQLGDNVISAQGGQYLLHSIPCGEYDVRLIDEDGDACEVRGVGLCAASGTWEITDEDLLECQVETDE